MSPGQGSNRSSATANITLQCTWRPSGLTIGLHGQDGWSVSASVNLPLHHKVQKFSGTGSPGWCQKKGRKTVVVVVVEAFNDNFP